MTGYEKVPLEVEKQSKGSSTYTLGHKLSLVVRGVTSFSSVPLVAMFASGGAILAVSLAAALYLILRRVLVGGYLTGWPSLIVSIWLLGGLILFCLGLVGIYLSHVFQETKSRPYTVIRRVYDATAGAT
jgi:putative glycosyltransferase